MRGRERKSESERSRERKRERWRERERRVSRLEEVAEGLAPHQLGAGHVRGQATHNVGDICVGGRVRERMLAAKNEREKLVVKSVAAEVEKRVVVLKSVRPKKSLDEDHNQKKAVLGGEERREGSYLGPRRGRQEEDKQKTKRASTSHACCSTGANWMKRGEAQAEDTRAKDARYKSARRRTKSVEAEARSENSVQTSAS